MLLSPPHYFELALVYFFFLCFTLLGLFLSLTSSKLLTSVSGPFPSTEDEGVIREQLKTIATALATLELV